MSTLANPSSTQSILTTSFTSLNESQANNINVTVYENEARYLYSQKNLLIAYGVSVLVSLLCIIAGFLTMWNNRIAFTDSLTTILRATRSKKFDDILPRETTTGADPPTQTLSDTRVLWVGAGDRDDSVAGLKPLPNDTEKEKGQDGSARASPAPSPRSNSPISFDNRIEQREDPRPAFLRAHLASTTPEGFI